jgi:hypothetical protein
VVNRQVIVLIALLFSGLSTSKVFAQFLTADSEADLYIADVVDGGTASDRWTTQFRLVNPGIATGAAANGTVFFYGDNGSPMVVTLGSVSGSVFTVSVPVSGSVRFETSGSSPTINQGFVRMTFDSPVSATAEFRNWKNGGVANGASVNAVTPSYLFWYFADAYTGIAVANPNASAVNCTGTFLDSQGNTLKSTGAIPMGPLTHKTFNPGPMLGLPSSTVGSFQWFCADGLGNPAYTISLGIAGTISGVTSSLPNSPGAFPIRHWEDIEKAFNYTVKVIQSAPSLSQYAALVGQPQLVIATDNTTINACAETPQSLYPCNGPAGTVKVWLSLAELLADSPSELAFVMAHELGHVVQRNLGNQSSYQMIFPLSSVNQTIETDADAFGLIVSLESGYDVYGVAGTLGKLMMITGTATVNAQYEENIQALLGTDMHTSVLNRLTDLFTRMQLACQLVSTSCQTYKNLAHPNFPGPIPFSAPRP